MRYGPNMTPDRDADLAQAETVKDDEVLEREGLEEELMQEGQSEVGEQISDADREKEA
jgi:hypothetical protein